MFGNTRLLVREEVAAVLIDQLERTAATASNAGQWFVSDVHVQTRLFRKQSIEVAQQCTAAGHHDAAFGHIRA